MKIAMFTNTYLPHVGGVANSVHSLEKELGELDQEVCVVAPSFPGAEESTDRVLRVPAIQNFNGSDFSVRIALPGQISDFLDAFGPDLIHSHHPFLLGDAALRAGHERGVPVVFTHHTLYEKYTHYVPLDSPALRRAAIKLAVEYANLCSGVIAPSQSVRELLERRGVTTPVTAIPTGIDLRRFRTGNGALFRKQLGIPARARVIGHVGRLAEEKNLDYLAEAVGRCLSKESDAVALIVGDGDARQSTGECLRQWTGGERVYMAGKRTGRELINAYAAMDVFAFSSLSETQGMVLAEAMAAGTPVVALDAPGAREIVRDGENGRLLPTETSRRTFARVLTELVRDRALRRRLTSEAAKTARDYTKRRTTRSVMAFYRQVQSADGASEDKQAFDPWNRLQRRVEIEWELLAQKAVAAAATIVPTSATEVEHA